MQCQMASQKHFVNNLHNNLLCQKSIKYSTYTYKSSSFIPSLAQVISTQLVVMKLSFFLIATIYIVVTCHVTKSAQMSMSNDDRTCQEIGSCSSLSAFCSNPSIASMCKITCQVSPCGPGAETLAPVTLVP